MGRRGRAAYAVAPPCSRGRQQCGHRLRHWSGRIHFTPATQNAGQGVEHMAIQRHTTDDARASSAAYLELAADGALAGLTRPQVVDALIGRIERDVHYLAYRRACRRHMRYDDQVTADLRARALPAGWLSESSTSAPPLGQRPVPAPATART